MSCVVYKVCDVDFFENLMLGSLFGFDFEIVGCCSVDIFNNYIEYNSDYLENNDIPIILLHPDVFVKQSDKFDEVMFKRGRKILECELTSLSDFSSLNYENYTLTIDKYCYYEDLIKSIIIKTKNIPLIVNFCGVNPSEDIVDMLRDVRASVFVTSESGRIYEASEWFTKSLEEKCKYEYDSFNVADGLIIYSDMIDTIDNIDCLMNVPKITFTNRTCVIPCHKVEPNNIYLEKTFNFIRKLKSRGYSGNALVDMDSIYDVSNSKFSYDNCDAFTDEDMTGIGNLLSYFACIARKYYEYPDLSLIDRLNNYFVLLLENCSNESSILSLLEHGFYDLLRMSGISFVRVPRTDEFLIFEKGNSKVVKFNPAYIYRCLKNIDRSDPIVEIPAFSSAFEKYSELGEDNVYENYLNCESIDEMKEIFSDRVASRDEVDYLRKTDIYNEELKFLIDILIDLSIDDYDEFTSKFKNLKTKEDFLNAFLDIASRIMIIKRENVGIVMKVYRFDKNDKK